MLKRWIFSFQIFYVNWGNADINSPLCIVPLIFAISGETRCNFYLTDSETDKICSVNFIPAHSISYKQV